MKSTVDSLPLVVSVEARSAAERAGLRPGDAVARVNGVVPRDILEWQRLVDEPTVELEVRRGHDLVEMEIERQAGEPFGVSINSAVFDRIHTCDNHCEFCFIYQLPKGMRRSLYLKDDDYRLSFLFGNFTTLTRFTEADLERVVDERLSPLYVSVHATDSNLRSQMLRNDRGGFSLRWMKELLRSNIDIRAQIVLCPGVNDSLHLERTLADLLEQCPALESIAIVPLGLSRFNTEGRMRVQTAEEAAEVIEIVERWQHRFAELLGRQPLFIADEFYLVAGRQVPDAPHYGDYPMLEDGVGLVRSFIDAYKGIGPEKSGRRDGFFSAVDSQPHDYLQTVNPARDTSLRASHGTTVRVQVRSGSSRAARLAVVTGSYGARVMREVLDGHDEANVRVVEVRNEYFGGNTGVAGLLTYSDVHRTLETEDRDSVFLLPDVCLNDGRFLDGGTIDELRREFDVEVIETSGSALRTRVTSHIARISHV